ncbi:hypothetical protein BGZ99_006455 [Dissophora globulifera]|uniref:Uncharacterized protein n=1 Tax=Dissophora globulifera TaxID=979702 RepID=A0A9P6UR45_9FUNG|nr:hypothetical protein BGZ99_006455 [Dissophora globulifera]
MVTDLEEVESTIEDDEPKISTHSVLDPDPAVSREHEDERETKLSSEFLRYHRKVEVHLMPKIDTKISSPAQTNVHEFLHEIRKTGVLKYSKKKFEKICYMLLSLANLDERTADSFVIAHEDDSNGIWD